MQSSTNPAGRAFSRVFFLLLLPWLTGPACGQTSTPLLLPSGIAYDSQGSLYIAETGRHQVIRLIPGGFLSVVAGTSIQGFSGDGGLATAAMLDSPGALAIDSADNVFVADAHNHRIRKVDAASGLIATYAGTGVAATGLAGFPAATTALDLPSALAISPVGDLYYADARAHVVRRIDRNTLVITAVAGTGKQGFSGDGGAASSAMLDTPLGLAFDGAGNLLISDGHNQRVRRVDAASGIIATVTGTGVAGYAPGTAAFAQLSLPRGLSFDAAGNLLIVDAGNHRVRRVDAATGQLVTIAGAGTEGFSGDGGPAVAATLDSPGAVTVSPSGLATLTDSENARVRQIDHAGVIQTIAGVGAPQPPGLLLTGPMSTIYGSGEVRVTLGGDAASGSIAFLDGTSSLGSAPLSANSASFSLAGLPTGSHHITAVFPGNATHATVQSNLLAVSVTPAPVLAAPVGLTVVYGLPVPALTGTLTGVLPQDSGNVSVTWTSGAALGAQAGSYAIGAALSGLAATNYQLTVAPSAVVIGKANSTVTLTAGLLVQAASSTTGSPGGFVNLLDGTSVAATQPLVGGAAQFTSTGLSTGSHTLSASYTGDADFNAATSNPQLVTIDPAGSPDFAITPVGSGNLTVSAGSPASFSFTSTPVNGGLSSPVVLSVAGLPAGATGSFSPALLVPGAAPIQFTLTIQTLKAELIWPGAVVFTAMVLLFPRRRRAAALMLLALLAGCGDRVNSGAGATASARIYNVTVTGTGTSSSGATIIHSTAVVLTVQ